MKSEKGFSLIEVIAAIALLGIVAVAFLGALGAASRTIFATDERATAESLARSQMEYVKDQAYIYYSDPDHDEYEKITPPSGYTVEFSAVPFNLNTGEPYDESGGVFVQDDGIQKITVTVEHLAEPEAEIVITLEGYKRKR